MRRFEFIEGKSNKFWEIEQAEKELNIRWGRVGTQGQSQTKAFADQAKAKASMDKLILEKTGKGYTEVSVDGQRKIGTAPVKASLETKQDQVSADAPDISPEKKRGEAADSSDTGAAKVAACVETQEATPSAPAESNDEQADRAFFGLLQQISDGVFDSREVSISVARIRKDLQVGEAAAQQAFLRLTSANLVWRYGATASLASNAKAQANALLALMASPDKPHTVQTNEPRHEYLENVPLWLQQSALRLLPEMMRHVLASRRFPQPVVDADAIKSWFKAREVFQANVVLAVDESEASLQAALKEIEARMESRKMDGSMLSDALLLACGLGQTYRDEGLSVHVMEFLKAKHGLLYLVDAYLEAQRISVKTEYLRAGSQSKYRKQFSLDVNAPFHASYYGPMSEADWMLRRYLSVASDSEYQQCVEKIQAALPGIDASRQAQLALLLPDEPEISNEIALRLGGNAGAPDAVHWLQLTANSVEAIKAARKVKSERPLLSDNAAVATLLQERGLGALDILLEGASFDAAGSALSCIGLPEAIDGLARAASGSKEALARYAQAITRWPAAAMAALAHLVALNGKEASLVKPGLLQLLRAHPDLVEKLLPWLENSSQQVLLNLATRLEGPKEVASDDELPVVLVNPPWLAKTKKKTVAALSLAPLELAPVEFWAEGEQEERKRIDNEYQRKRFENIQKNPRLFLNEINLESTHKNQVKTNLPAQKALEDGDGQQLAEMWLKAKAADKNGYWSLHLMCLTALPENTAVSFWNHVVSGALKLGSYLYSYERITACYGLKILPGLMALVSARPAENMSLMMNFGVVEIASVAARAFAKLKSLRETGRAWLLRFPEHAIAGLIAPALGKAGEARDCAAVALRLLATEGYEDKIVAMARQYGQAEVLDAVQAMLSEDPLDRFPTRRAALPEFWQPEGWNRPVLINGKALPDQALVHLGTMLTFPINEGLYAGLEEVKACCTRDSLAAFMWDGFSAWLTAGAPAKENWALTMQGPLGNDETARKLTPYIREWPGESAHARAVTALDVLASIGSDVALMLLNGIAQKVKFKGLQDKAREKINAIAEARGFSTEELEDRLAPDLGLDEQGTLILDFGPRQFKVGFDEALKPYVREVLDGRDGVRLNDLPKPKKTDDENLGKAAVERFKLLKKDARTIASQQVLRLEVAMCSRRRWQAEIFRTFLALHPLVRHLVQRLIWGVYECESGSSYGGKLQACFRVNEDGSYTDANDDEFILPEGDNLFIGVPHALEMSPAVAAAFGQLLADYELIQPFKQIGRDTYTLGEAEQKTLKLERWKGVVVPTGRVLGLVNKGWRRGQAQDGGGIWYFTKALDSGNVIELTLDPGIIVGMVNEYPEQTLQDIQVGKPSSWGEINTPKPMSSLGAIEASELIRDMEQLRA